MYVCMYIYIYIYIYICIHTYAPAFIKSFPSHVPLAPQAYLAPQASSGVGYNDGLQTSKGQGGLGEEKLVNFTSKFLTFYFFLIARVKLSRFINYNNTLRHPYDYTHK